MTYWRGIVIALGSLAAALAAFVAAAVSAPSPGVVTGGFCTYRTGYIATSTEAAQRINTYFGSPDIFHVGTVETPKDDPATYAYTWLKTKTLVSVGKGKNTVQVDSGVAALQEAIRSGGHPGAF